MQIVKTLIRRRVLWRLIMVYIVCHFLFYGLLCLNGLMELNKVLFCIVLQCNSALIPCLEMSVFGMSWVSLYLYFIPYYCLYRKISQYCRCFKSLRGSCKKFCHWFRITSVLRFIKHIFITNLQSISPLLKHIFVTFLPIREKQINSLLLVSVGDTDQ